MDADSRPLVPVIVGPTGIGKTALATALAAVAPIEIISADSRQVYRGLDIGTAKPSAQEQQAAPYHGLDLIEPAERFSAGRFARDAAGWLVGAAQRGRLPVVVGGTGFYLKALFDGLFEEPVFDEERRGRLRESLNVLPAVEQVRWARRLDDGFKGGGTQRAQRAIEVALLSGTPLSRHQQDAPAAPSPARPWYVVLELSRDALAARIAARGQAMLAAGLVDEVRRALASGLEGDEPGLSGVGYPEVIAMLRGELAEDALPEAIATATRRYAKRQETWFRHQLHGPVLLLDASLAPGALAEALLTGYRAALDG